MEPLRRTWHVQQGVGCHDDGWLVAGAHGWLATAVGEACRSTNQGYGWHEFAECDRILSVSRKLNRCWRNGCAVHTYYHINESASCTDPLLEPH